MSKFKDILKETRDRNLPEEEISEDNDEITKEQRIATRKNKYQWQASQWHLPLTRQ
jgi:hypothetical protein